MVDQTKKQDDYHHTNKLGLGSSVYQLIYEVEDLNVNPFIRVKVFQKSLVSSNITVMDLNTGELIQIYSSVVGVPFSNTIQESSDWSFKKLNLILHFQIIILIHDLHIQTLGILYIIKVKKTNVTHPLIRGILYGICTITFITG